MEGCEFSNTKRDGIKNTKPKKMFSDMALANHAVKDIIEKNSNALYFSDVILHVTFFFRSLFLFFTSFQTLIKKIQINVK